MGGAIYQLQVRGEQDSFLTGKPEYTFIKQVYKRHVNFSIDKKILNFKNNVNFGQKIEVILPRKADFLHKLYFAITLPALVKTSGEFAGWTNSIGHAIIDYIDIIIGDQLISRHYGLYMEIWNELTTSTSNVSANQLLIGKYTHLKGLETNSLRETRYEVPLQFWFCNHIGAALPLLNLQFHSVKIHINLKTFDECIVYDGITPPNRVSIVSGEILAEYIYIDDSERLKLLGKTHSYLITQVQSINGESINLLSGGLHKSLLDFNHPCNELLFVMRENENELNNDWFNYAKRNVTVSTPVEPLITRAKLILDGNEFTEYLSEYTLRVSNSSRYHTNTTDKHIYIIPFCHEPEKWYPNGSLNFSKIDQAELHIQMASGINSNVKLYVFAKNFNMLYIEKGMVQLGFSS
jgi:hypothetical protein